MAKENIQDCWKCHWCWFGRCMNACQYGKDVCTLMKQSEERCSGYTSKEDWNKQYVQPMTQKRCMGLLNAMINNLSVAEKNNDVIRKLLEIGFNEDELINHFSFTETDVEDVLKEIREEE